MNFFAWVRTAAVLRQLKLSHPFMGNIVYLSLKFTPS